MERDMSKEELIAWYKAAIESSEEGIIAAQVRQQRLRTELADLLCPFKSGDRVKHRGKVYVVSAIEPSASRRGYGLKGHLIKTDGRISEHETDLWPNVEPA